MAVYSTNDINDAIRDANETINKIFQARYKKNQRGSFVENRNDDLRIMHISRCLDALSFARQLENAAGATDNGFKTQKYTGILEYYIYYNTPKSAYYLDPTDTVIEDTLNDDGTIIIVGGGSLGDGDEQFT